jgi:hypothetical protein
MNMKLANGNFIHLKLVYTQGKKIYPMKEGEKTCQRY